VPQEDDTRWWTPPKWLGRTGIWAQSWLDRHRSQLDPEWELKTSQRHVVLWSRLIGSDSGPTNRARADAARALEDLGRWQEARVIRENVLESHKRHQGEDDKYTLGAEMWLARNYMKCGEGLTVRSIAAHAYEECRRQFGDEDEMTGRAQRLLASIDAESGYP
jgi:hypothetical protein